MIKAGTVYHYCITYMATKKNGFMYHSGSLTLAQDIEHAALYKVLREQIEENLHGEAYAIIALSKLT